MAIINTWNKCNCYDQLVTRQCSVHIHHSYHACYAYKYQLVTALMCHRRPARKMKWPQPADIRLYIHITYPLPPPLWSCLLCLQVPAGIRLSIHMFIFLAPLPIPPQLPPLLYHLLSTLNSYYVILSKIWMKTTRILRAKRATRIRAE